MQAERTYNVNVIAQDVLMTPAEIKKRLPITPRAEEFVLQSRATLQRIIDRQDPRLFVVVGPCSVHDLRAARDYAQRLKKLAAESLTKAERKTLISLLKKIGYKAAAQREGTLGDSKNNQVGKR